MMKKSVVALGVSLLLANSAWAMPTGGKIIAGEKNISGFSANPATGAIITVNGSAGIYWDNFDLKSGEKITFDIKNPGAILTITTKKSASVVIGGNLNQTGTGKLQFWENNITVMPSGSISANALLIQGNNFSASGKINVLKSFEIYNKGNISGKNLNITAGDMILGADQRLSLVNSNLKALNKNITLVSQKSYSNGYVTTAADNGLEISKCQLNASDEIYVHAHAAEINNNKISAMNRVQLNAIASHYWKASQNMNVNKSSAVNTMKLSNNIIDAVNFVGINGGSSNLQGNTITSKNITVASCNDIRNYEAKRVVPENISVLDKNMFKSANVSLISGPSTIDGKEYNKQGKYSYLGKGDTIAVNILSDGTANIKIPESISVSKPKDTVSTSGPKTSEVKDMTLEADGYYTMGDNPNDSVALAKAQAKNAAMRSIVEQTGVYIESYSEVINAKLTTDEIKAISSNIIKIKECKYTTTPTGDAVTYKCHIVADVNADEIDMTVVLKNRDQKKLEDKIAELERRYAEMERKLK